MMKGFRWFLGIVVSFVYAGGLGGLNCSRGYYLALPSRFHLSYVAVRVHSTWREASKCLMAMSLEEQG